MSHPVDGENNEAMQPTSPETESPEQAVSDAINEAEAIADATPLTEADVADVEIPDAEIPALDIPAPEIPDPVLPASALAEPAAAADDDAPVPATRAQRKALPSVASLPETPPIPRDPAVVPPPSGATTGGYRGWTIAIFAILLLLLIGAIVTVIVLATSGPSLFAAPAVAAMGWIPPAV